MEGIHPKEIRLRLGLSQERFARRLGVSQQTVRRWESGLTRPLPIITGKLEELAREAGRTWPGREGVPMRTAKAAGIEIESGLGGLFKGVGSLLNLVSKMAEAGKDESARSGEIETPGGKIIYGFSVRMGLGGKPVIEGFGNIQETESGPAATEVREPIVDVLDEGKELVVVAELPGIREEDIHLEVRNDVLQISASTGDRKYHKDVALSCEVVQGSLKSSYRNGVLEVRVAKV